MPSTKAPLPTKTTAAPSLPNINSTKNQTPLGKSSTTVTTTNAVQTPIASTLPPIQSSNLSSSTKDRSPSRSSQSSFITKNPLSDRDVDSKVRVASSTDVKSSTDRETDSKATRGLSPFDSKLKNDKTSYDRESDSSKTKNLTENTTKTDKNFPETDSKISVNAYNTKATIDSKMSNNSTAKDNKTDTNIETKTGSSTDSKTKTASEPVTKTSTTNTTSNRTTDPNAKAKNAIEPESTNSSSTTVGRMTDSNSKGKNLSEPFAKTSSTSTSPIKATDLTPKTKSGTDYDARSNPTTTLPNKAVDVNSKSKNSLPNSNNKASSDRVPDLKANKSIADVKGKSDRKPLVDASKPSRASPLPDKSRSPSKTSNEKGRSSRASPPNENSKNRSNSRADSSKRTSNRNSPDDKAVPPLNLPVAPNLPVEAPVKGVDPGLVLAEKIQEDKKEELIVYKSPFMSRNEMVNTAAGAIGNTPLVTLNSIGKGLPGKIAVKLEYTNPAGSVKDRVGFHMIEDAEQKGLIQPGKTVLVEPTSGNMGIALAMCARIKGYKLILTMPASMSIERRSLLKAYGAEVILTDPAQAVKGARQRAREISAAIPNIHILDQFGNPANVMAHYKTTGPEIWEQTNGKVDIVCFGVGSGGTMSGVGKYLKEKKPEIEVFPVEPFESSVINGLPHSPHKIQGMGTGFIPEILDKTLFKEALRVHSDDAIAMAKRLATEEAILGGISSGANVCAAVQLASRPENAGKLIVTNINSFGERYLSTALYADIKADAESMRESTLEQALETATKYINKE